MIDNFLPEFLAKINEVAENGPWIMQKKSDDNINDNSIIILDDMNAVEKQLELGTVKCLVRKDLNESNLLKIISVRCHVTTTLSTRNIQIGSDKNVVDVCNRLENKELLIECNKYDWHILCGVNFGKEENHVYESISEATLSEIVSSPIIFNWKIESYVFFLN